MPIYYLTRRSPHKIVSVYHTGTQRRSYDLGCYFGRNLRAASLLLVLLVRTVRADVGATEAALVAAFALRLAFRFCSPDISFSDIESRG